MNGYPYQLLPPLTRPEKDRLKASIKELGVRVAIVVDDEGNILDGHHRAAILEELREEGTPVAEPERVVRSGLSEEQKRQEVLTLNVRRRQLHSKMRRELVRRELVADPARSDRVIAELVGVSAPIVSDERQQMEATGQLLKISTSAGKDGKTYRRKKKQKIAPEDVRGQKPMRLNNRKRNYLASPDGEPRTSGAFYREEEAYLRKAPLLGIPWEPAAGAEKILSELGEQGAAELCRALQQLLSAGDREETAA